MEVVVYKQGEPDNDQSRTRFSPSNSAGDAKRKSNGRVEVRVYESKSCESFRQVGQGHAVGRPFLYKEALYTAIHMLGKPSFRFPSSQNDLLTYVQVTFAKDPQEQQSFIQDVAAEPFPLNIVNIGIRRAEHLEGRDKSGLSDPYCLISVETDESVEKSEWRKLDVGSPLHPKTVKGGRERPMAEERHDQLYTTLPKSIRTSIQHQTLNPVWEERFQCLALRPSNDILHVEVWDHDDDAEVIHSIQGATNRRRTAEMEEGTELLQDGFKQGKKDDFLGKATAKISEIPVEGEEKWYYLEGKTHRGHEAQGRLLLQIWLTHSFRHGIHYTPLASPRFILEKMWEHVLEVECDRNGGTGVWDGEIPIAATSLLFQYGLQNGMSESAQAIIRFNAYSKRSLQLQGTELRLRELDTSLKKCIHLSEGLEGEKIDHCDEKEMLSSLLTSLKVPFVTLKNHLREPQEKVQEALQAFMHVRSLFERMGKQDHLQDINQELQVALRAGILEFYQEVSLQNLPRGPNQAKLELLCSMAKVLRFVKEKLHEVEKVWKSLFWMEAKVEYLPIFFHEIQKMIVHDVEGITTSILKNYSNNDQLRNILLHHTSEEKGISRCFFELYQETQEIVLFQDRVFEGTEGRRKYYPNLDEYYEWFRPMLVLWLGFAFIRAHDLISKSIHLDQVDSEKAMLSSSAVDTVGVFRQLAAFEVALNWPDPAQNCVVALFLIEITAYYSILFAKMKRKKIDMEGYFDTLDRFDISDRLCRSLNNIHYVQETVQKLPEEMKIEKLLEDLGETVGRGSETMKICHDRIIDSLSTSLVETEREILVIVDGIASRVRPELRRAWDECMARLESGMNSDENLLDPLYEYLEPNLQTLHDSLLHPNFVRLLEMFWRVVCEELMRSLARVQFSTTAEQNTLFRRLQSVLPPLMDYLKGNGEGIHEKKLNTEQFRRATELLQMFNVDSTTLMATFFMTRAKEQLELKGTGKYGTLQVRVNIEDTKVSVQVISGKNMTPMDYPSRLRQLCWKLSPPTSDPRVEIDLITDGWIEEGNSQKTASQKQTLNPVFDEIFHFQIERDRTESQYTVVRFTVRDVDIFSRNDFMGEAMVQISRMPGALGVQKPVPQPMNLQLRSFDSEELNSYILVLKSRTWEAQSQEFVSSQMSRNVRLKK